MRSEEFHAAWISANDKYGVFLIAYVHFLDFLVEHASIN